MSVSESAVPAGEQVVTGRRSRPDGMFEDKSRRVS